MVLHRNGAIDLNYKSFSGTMVEDFGSGISRGDGSAHLSLSEAYGKVYTLAGRSFRITKGINLGASINPIVSPTKEKTLTISGTMTGTRATISAGPSAKVGAVTYPTPTTWMCTLSSLREGAHTILVQTTDDKGNTGSATASFLMETSLQPSAPDTTATPATPLP